MARRRAVRLAIVAGLLLVVAGATSGSLLLELGDQAARALLPPHLAETVHLLVSALLFVAGLGGVAVIAGALLWRRGWMRSGSLCVDLGAGTGFLGLLLLLGLSLWSGQLGGLVGWLLGPAGLGVVLSVWARREAGEALVPEVPRAVRRGFRQLRAR